MAPENIITPKDILTPKEFGALIGRSEKWVRAQCRRRKLPTIPPHKAPYLMPKATLFKVTGLTAL